MRTAYTELKSPERRFYESGKPVFTREAFKEAEKGGCGLQGIAGMERKTAGRGTAPNRNAMVRLGRFCHGMFDGMGMEREGIYTEIIRSLTDYQGILLQHQIENGAYDTSQIFQPDYLYQFKTSGNCAAGWRLSRNRS